MAPKPQYLAGKGADVIRVLLTDYPKAWALRELAERSGASLSWVSEISQSLIADRLALRDSLRGELRLTNPEDLLGRWAVANDFSSGSPVAEYYTSEEDITKFMALFAQTRGPDYAFTGLAAALKVAPHVRPTNVRLYVRRPEDAKEWARLLDLQPIERGGNVNFFVPQSPGVFYGGRKIDDVMVISDVQLYADLYHYPARGEEAAGEVLKTIEKKWQTVRRGADKSGWAERFSSKSMSGWEQSLISRDGRNEYMVQSYAPPLDSKDTRSAFIRIIHYILLPGKKSREAHMLRFVIDWSNHPPRETNPAYHIDLDGPSRDITRECSECSKYLPGLDHLFIPQSPGIGVGKHKPGHLQNAGDAFFSNLKKILGDKYSEEPRHKMM